MGVFVAGIGLFGIAATFSGRFRGWRCLCERKAVIYKALVSVMKRIAHPLVFRGWPLLNYPKETSLQITVTIYFPYEPDLVRSFATGGA